MHVSCSWRQYSHSSPARRYVAFGTSESSGRREERFHPTGRVQVRVTTSRRPRARDRRAQIVETRALQTVPGGTSRGVAATNGEDEGSACGDKLWMREPSAVRSSKKCGLSQVKCGPPFRGGLRQHRGRGNDERSISTREMLRTSPSVIAQGRTYPRAPLGARVRPRIGSRGATNRLFEGRPAWPGRPSGGAWGGQGRPLLSVRTGRQFVGQSRQARTSGPGRHGRRAADRGAGSSAGRAVARVLCASGGANTSTGRADPGPEDRCVAWWRAKRTVASRPFERARRPLRQRRRRRRPDGHVIGKYRKRASLNGPRPRSGPRREKLSAEISVSGVRDAVPAQ